MQRSVWRCSLYTRPEGLLLYSVVTSEIFNLQHDRQFVHQIEIKATPSGGVVNGSRKTKKTTIADHSLKSATVPPKIAYEPTIKDKMCCKAITFMKVGPNC